MANACETPVHSFRGSGCWKCVTLTVHTCVPR
jgi:hypothetical protein